MEQEPEKKAIGIVSVKRIKGTRFFIDERLYKPEIPQIKSQLEAKLGFNATLNLVALTLRAFYVYDEFPDEVVMDITVENVFEITDLINFIPKDTDVTPEQMNLPTKVIVNIVALSISHTRALFGNSISGTVMDSIYLPITDPVSAAKAFFPNKIIDSEL